MEATQCPLVWLRGGEPSWAPFYSKLLIYFFICVMLKVSGFKISPQKVKIAILVLALGLNMWDPETESFGLKSCLFHILTAWLVLCSVSRFYFLWKRNNNNRCFSDFVMIKWLSIVNFSKECLACRRCPINVSFNTGSGSSRIAKWGVLFDLQWLKKINANAIKGADTIQFLGPH